MCFTYLSKQVIQWGGGGGGGGSLLHGAFIHSFTLSPLKREYLSSPPNISLILSASCDSPTPFINE